MSIIREAIERAHAEGKIVTGMDVYDVPDEYKPLIGKLSDHMLFSVSYRYDEKSDEWVGPQAEVPVEVIESIGETLGWKKQSTSKVVRIVLADGLEKIRVSRASEYLKQDGIGRKTIDALVSIGLIDDRDEVEVIKTSKPKVVDCYIVGQLYEDVERAEYDLDTLEIHRIVEQAFGYKEIRGRFVGRIYTNRDDA